MKIAVMRDKDGVIVDVGTLHPGRNGFRGSDHDRDQGLEKSRGYTFEEIDIDATLRRIKELEGVVSDAPARLANVAVRECERAMKQRDEYLKTKRSTAGHGWAHDTCFEALFKREIKKALKKGGE